MEERIRNILVTGGTVFVSKYVAEYYAKRGDNVYVLNRNSRPQPEGTTLIKADRHQLGATLRDYKFDVILDVTSYNKTDVAELVAALGTINQYIFISSSAVYPETLPQPFQEDQTCGPNSIWGDYGVGKWQAEQFLAKEVPQAYILRPPYLYGPMENVYREPFVFDCANQDRPFYIPKDGSMPLQFFHVDDLCRFIDILLEKQPTKHTYNVGNTELVDINQWVKICYEVVGKPLRTIYLDESHPQRSFFPFYDYAYELDVSAQTNLMPTTKPLKEGLRESYEWYMSHQNEVKKKPFFEYLEKVDKK